MSNCTFKGNLEVPNDGTIGSVGKDDVLTIGSGGDLTIKGDIEIYGIKKDPPPPTPNSTPNYTSEYNNNERVIHFHNNAVIASGSLQSNFNAGGTPRIIFSADSTGSGPDNWQAGIGTYQHSGIGPTLTVFTGGGGSLDKDDIKLQINNNWVRASVDLYATSTSTANQPGNSSDDRLKENEEYISNGLNTIMKLKPQVYDKKDNMTSTNTDNWQKESGFIAQEIYYDAPELRHLVKIIGDLLPDDIPTSSDPTQDPDYSSWGEEPAILNYTGIIPYLVKGIQEQQTTIESQLSTINTLTTNYNSLLARVTALENT